VRQTEQRYFRFETGSISMTGLKSEASLMSIAPKTPIRYLSLYIVSIFIAFVQAANANSSQKSCGTDPPVFEVGEHRFEIPMAYLIGLNPSWAVARKRCGGVRETIGIDAFLPGFGPVPPDAKEHRGGGMGRVVGVMINMNPRGMSIDERYIRAIFGRPEVKNSELGRQVGLKHHADPHPNGRDAFVALSDGYANLFLSCDRESAGMKYPLCHMYTSYSASVVLTVSFGRSRILEWKTIRDGVSKLVSEFEASRGDTSIRGVKGKGVGIN
jgi:hypothetical protein